MRFLPSGPRIPDSLLEERDRGNVVFFCGAGISQPAGLPGFLDLAERVNSSLGSPKGSASSDILERIRMDPTYAPPLDQVFSILQQVYGAAVIDDAVAQQAHDPSKCPHWLSLDCPPAIPQRKAATASRDNEFRSTFREGEQSNSGSRSACSP